MDMYENAYTVNQGIFVFTKFQICNVHVQIFQILVKKKAVRKFSDDELLSLTCGTSDEGTTIYMYN